MPVSCHFQVCKAPLQLTSHHHCNQFCCRSLYLRFCPSCQAVAVNASENKWFQRHVVLTAESGRCRLISLVVCESAPLAAARCLFAACT